MVVDYGHMTDASVDHADTRAPETRAATVLRESPSIAPSSSVAFAGASASTGAPASAGGAAPAPSNMLKHIESLEKIRERLENELRTEKNKNEKMSAKTREGMQSALDTLMKKWMDAVETKDDKVKDHFKEGMNKLVQNSAEENGVWQMMVAASALHERQTHDLDKLRTENEEMRKGLDGRFAAPESRKRPADEQLDRASVEDAGGADAMWDDFARDVGGMY